MDDLLHLHQNRLKSDINVFLLFIPIVVFVSILFVFLICNKDGKLSQILGQSPILGAKTEALQEGK